MDEKNVFEIIMASTVISAIVSGMISLLISRLEAKNALKLSRSNRKLELSVEIFNKLQSALAELDNVSQEEHPEEDFNTKMQDAFIKKYQATERQMLIARRTIDQLAYLVPKDRIQGFKQKYADIEQLNVSLFQCAWKTKGANIHLDVPETITEDNFVENMMTYIKNVQGFLDLLKEEITDVLRTLCEE